MAKLRFTEDFQIRIRCLTGEGVLLKMSSHDFIRKILVHSGVKSQVLQTVKSKLQDFLYKPLMRFQQIRGFSQNEAPLEQPKPEEMKQPS